MKCAKFIKSSEVKEGDMYIHFTGKNHFIVKEIIIKNGWYDFIIYLLEPNKTIKLGTYANDYNLPWERV